MTAERILRLRGLWDDVLAVCALHRADVDAVFSRNQAPEVVRARREIMCLKYARGLDVETIAELLGMHVNSVLMATRPMRAPRVRREPPRRRTIAEALKATRQRVAEMRGGGERG